MLETIDSSFEKLRKISPGKVQCEIDNSDQNECSWGVTLWNCFGKWYATDNNLGKAILKAVAKAENNNFGF
jgi:hypothetical protein